MARKIHQWRIKQKLKKTNITVAGLNILHRFKLPNRTVKLECFSSLHHSKFIHDIGAYSYSYSSLSENTVIGRYCSIAKGVNIMGDDHPLDRYTTSRVTYGQEYLDIMPITQFTSKEKLVTIGNDVWIGENVTLKRGVAIGDGAVIATGSIVTKDVEPYSIVGGIPAKLIRYRFSEKIRMELLKIKWWRYDLSKHNISPTIDINDFISRINNIEESEDVFKCILL
ncbi:CatB-related O-acetyltransferase [Vibrio aphrogenes]|uniref:CatB-related O-acetyltransferase n=1 Tax=Vibrio aphrogenes TaxID=1891186 RepID=UPI000B35322C|nr:CatB-related O-acetyltransferase [Vibrio aphrogenes]